MSLAHVPRLLRCGAVRVLPPSISIRCPPLIHWQSVSGTIRLQRKRSVTRRTCRLAPLLRCDWPLHGMRRERQNPAEEEGLPAVTSARHPCRLSTPSVREPIFSLRGVRSSTVNRTINSGSPATGILALLWSDGRDAHGCALVVEWASKVGISRAPVWTTGGAHSPGEAGIPLLAMPEASICLAGNTHGELCQNRQSCWAAGLA